MYSESWEVNQRPNVRSHIRRNNVGYSLIEKMGWRYGDGLGITGTGPEAPLMAMERNPDDPSPWRCGLGFGRHQQHERSGDEPIGFVSEGHFDLIELLNVLNVLLD